MSGLYGKEKEPVSRFLFLVGLSDQDFCGFVALAADVDARGGIVDSDALKIVIGDREVGVTGNLSEAGGLQDNGCGGHGFAIGVESRYLIGMACLGGGVDEGLHCDGLCVKPQAVAIEVVAFQVKTYCRSGGSEAEIVEHKGEVVVAYIADSEIECPFGYFNVDSAPLACGSHAAFACYGEVGSSASG